MDTCRSGKQNIIEGAMASATSKETEIKLISVARASLEELLGDYRDFLRVRKMPLWNKNHPQAQAVRRLAHETHVSYGTHTGKLRPAMTKVSAHRGTEWSG